MNTNWNKFISIICFFSCFNFFSNVSIEILRQILIFFFLFIFCSTDSSLKRMVRTIKGLVYFILYLYVEIVPIIGILVY